MPGNPTAMFQERFLSALEAIQVSTDLSRVADEAVQVSQATLAAANAASFLVTYVFQDQNFDTAWTEDIISPISKRGRVRAVDVYECTETFANTGSDARIDIGIAGDVAIYAVTAGFGTLASGVPLAPAVTQGATEILPLNTIARISGITAGTPGNGIATIAVTIEYFD